jgi:hypothetical protein
MRVVYVRLSLFLTDFSFDNGTFVLSGSRFRNYACTYLCGLHHTAMLSPSIAGWPRISMSCTTMMLFNVFFLNLVHFQFPSVMDSLRRSDWVHNGIDLSVNAVTALLFHCSSGPGCFSTYMYVYTTCTLSSAVVYSDFPESPGFFLFSSHTCRSYCTKYVYANNTSLWHCQSKLLLICLICKSSDDRVHSRHSDV